jgi:hypothetical protein
MSSEAKTLDQNNAEHIATWCGGRAVVQHDALDHDSTAPGVNVPVGDSVERAQVGDTVIRNHDGSFRISRRNESER